MYRNRHVGVQSTAVAKANLSRESKVASNLLERCRYRMSEKKKKNNKNSRLCRQGLYLEINIADLRKVFACTVTFDHTCIYNTLED